MIRANSRIGLSFSLSSDFKDRFSPIIDCCTVGEAGGCISPEDALKMADRESGSISMVFNFDTVWNNGNYGSIGKKRRGHQNRCPFAQE
jgi:hypothetical protein